MEHLCCLLKVQEPLPQDVPKCEYCSIECLENNSRIGLDWAFHYLRWCIELRCTFRWKISAQTGSICSLLLCCLNRSPSINPSCQKRINQPAKTHTKIHNARTNRWPKTNYVMCMCIHCTWINKLPAMYLPIFPHPVSSKSSHVSCYLVKNELINLQ